MATKAAQDKLRKSLAFEVTDPRGNVVICAQSVWDGHIAKDHPEMDGRIDDVKTAIVDPDSIRESTVRPDAQVFEWVASDALQIRVAITFDEVNLAASGGSIAKVNSAYPIDPVRFDKPNVGTHIYKRPASPKTGEEEG